MILLPNNDEILKLIEGVHNHRRAMSILEKKNKEFTSEELTNFN